MFKLLSLLPSITFGIYSSEIFPWATLYSFLNLNRKIHYLFFILISIIFFSSLFGILYYLDFSFEIFRSFFAYFNSLLIFYVILQKKINYDNVIFNLFKFLIFLAFIQYLGFFDNFNSFFQFLIPRGSLVDLTMYGGRGVTLLSNEPQRAYLNLIFLYIYIIVFKQKNILIDLLFLLFSVLFLRSFTGLVFHLFYFIIFYRFKFVFILALGVVPFIFLDILENNRLMIIFDQLIQFSTFEDVLFAFNNLSGFRGISIFSAFFYGFHFPFGGFVGFWDYSSLVAFQLTGLDPSTIDYFVYMGNSDWISLRPTSFFSSLFLDLGIFGFSIFLFFLFKLLKVYYNFDSKRINSYLLIFFIYLFFFGEVGDPVPWIISSSVIVKYNNLRHA
jgi:hypothetical protein